MNGQEQWVQKLVQFKKLQKTHLLHYTILKTLAQSLQQHPNLASNQTFQFLLKSLPKQIKSLTLYKQIVHLIWMQDIYPIKVRQQCCPQILKAVTQWIMEFQIKADKIKTQPDKFNLVKEYIEKNCKDMEWTVLIVSEIFQDLKDLFEDDFWQLPQENLKTCQQYSFIVQAEPQTPQSIICLLELIIYRQIQSIPCPKQTSQQIIPHKFYLSTYHTFAKESYCQFVLRCLNYLLCLQLTQSYQCQATKLALEFIRSFYCVQNPTLTVNLFRRLMLRTKKAVRYALVQQYVETYKFFHMRGCDQIIQQLEDMIFFRQLIIGQAKMNTEHQRVLEENVSPKYFSELSIKAGSRQRAFFSVQDCDDSILKLELMLDEDMDINLKIYHLTSGSKETLYHEEPKTQLRKLDLKITYGGLYAVQFDNSYSWIHAKKVLYHFHIMKKIDNTPMCND